MTKETTNTIGEQIPNTRDNDAPKTSYSWPNFRSLDPYTFPIDPTTPDWYCPCCKQQLQPIKQEATIREIQTVDIDIHWLLINQAIQDLKLLQQSAQTEKNKVEKIKEEAIERERLLKQTYEMLLDSIARKSISQFVSRKVERKSKVLNNNLLK